MRRCWGWLRFAAKVASQLPCSDCHMGALPASLPTARTPNFVEDCSPGRPLAGRCEERIIRAGRLVFVGSFKARAGAIDLSHGERRYPRRRRAGKIACPPQPKRPEKSLRKRPLRRFGSNADRRAKSPRRKRSPSAPPAPPASARETAESGAWAAGSTPAARREAGAGEPPAGIKAAETTSAALPGRASAQPAEPARAGQGHGDHDDGDDGDPSQFQVVQCERGVGVAAEEPTVLDLEAGIVGGLADVYPALLPCCGNQVKGGQADPQGGGDGGAQHGRPGMLKQAARPARRRRAGSWPSRPAAHSRAMLRPPPAPAAPPSHPMRA